jgi:SAM-dependent methyltransferase
VTPGAHEEKPNSVRLYETRQLREIAARWDAKAERWDRELLDPLCHLNEDRAYDRFLDQAFAIIQQRTEFCRRHGAIDAGCATGLVLARVISSFAWGTGVDISPRMIQIAQAKRIPAAEFIVGDCFKLSSLCSKAGAVFSRGVLLSHYGDAHALSLLQSAYAVLVEGGFIFLDFLNLAGRAKYQHAPPNKAYFEPASVGELAGKAGFSKVRTFAEGDRRVGLILAERR